MLTLRHILAISCILCLQTTTYGFGLATTPDSPANKELLKPSKDRPTGKVYTIVEQQPVFSKGTQELMQWLTQNLKYPKQAQEEKIEGRVVVQFVVTPEGEVVMPRVLRGVHKTLDDEAIRVVKSMPRWEPGKIGGKPVSSYFTLPIVFSL